MEFRSAAALVDDDSGVQSLAAAIRPFVPQIWDGLEIAQRRRLLRHVQSYWNNVRHRMAPPAFDRLAAARSSGQITIIKGRPLAVVPGTNGSALRVLARMGTRTTALAADFIVNSTGPTTDPAATDNPLLLDMLKRGLVRTGPLGLGLDIDGDCRPIACNGEAHRNLFALGPLTKSRFWEITAIPEIRDQAARMAVLLCRAPP